jgi:alpha-glucosidase
VADYQAVDPRVGTIGDFREMVAALQKANIKVLVDIVPNHTSSEHVWFKEALKAPKHSDARSNYHFRDGAS